jgi:Ca-activated chloride channel family protein
MQFHTPLALLILVLIPTAVFFHLRPKRRPALRFSSVAAVKNLKPSMMFRLRHMPLILRIVLLGLLAVALARPQKGTERVVERTEGVAIEMVVDRSGSMGQEMKYKGERLNRLGAVKRVFKEFLMGNDQTLKGRPSDLVGMVAFARYPDTVCPLIHNHEALIQFADATDVVRLRSEDGTAIGDAIALAAARLKTAEEELARNKTLKAGGEFKIKSKAIVLLTDGENNAGRRSPQQAAELARQWGIKVYCVGIVGEPVMDIFDRIFNQMRQRSAVGASELKGVAETTGGFYQEAEDEDSLRKIYEKIDALEKTEITSERFLDYKERFAPWAVAALCLLAIETVLSHTVFRRLP